MSYDKPGHLIRRQGLNGHEAHWVKMLEAPVGNVATPDLLLPTNPVPEFMQSMGYAEVNVPHTFEPDLMHGDKLTMFDGKELTFYLFREKILKFPFDGGSYPGPTYRVPRGVIFHAKTHGHGPPPHTIHWHGIEPTPANDGVGHNSFEIGNYTYQWQPNHIGTYFYHCHKNTIQHFKFGLYGGLILEPPDAFEQGPGKNPGGYPRRTAANLKDFPQFPGFVGGTLESGDPHAQTVPYDVEAFWVIDDVDSVWMETMKNPRATLPRAGSKPGVNDRFTKGDFHDYNPDYFVVTGANFPGTTFGSADLAPGLTIPAPLNSGVAGMQISIQAKVNQTVLVRGVCAAYTHLRITFPVDTVVIAADGRSMGIPPYDRYNRPFLVPAGQVIDLDTAERKDFLFRTTEPLNSFAKIEYLSSRGETLIFTGRIPIQVN